ncbi:MAG: Ldh family oxidoreductase [Burkholderiaceae bacterium]|jgi:(2R)-3-sulfolactate dehydrogenase (NADP+)
MKIHSEELIKIVAEFLSHSGANVLMAQAAAKALILAESQGLSSHGLSRVNQYATHLRNGRVNGLANPTVIKRKSGALVVDAQEGLAFGACELAVNQAVLAAKDFGVAFAGVIRSHHCGVVVDHLRAVANAGMVGIGFSNSPAAMPAAGGRHPIFGTDPIAAVFPRRDGKTPLMIDLSLSEVARGKLMVAAKEGKSIPLGWALDGEGLPTTDPKAGLTGSMLPFGSAANSSPKGAMLALMVELLVTAVIGANFGFEASSFFIDEGNRPGLGQAFIVIDPGALAGRDNFLDRVEELIAEMLKDESVRLPGARREALRLKMMSDGFEVSDEMLSSWKTF